MSIATFEIFVPERGDLVSESLDERRAHAQEIAEGAAHALTEAGLTAEPRVEEGSPAKETIRVANEIGADLIVVGAGRRSWLGNVILGSTSMHLLHESERSVLVVHPRDEAPATPAKVILGVDGSASCKVAVDVAARFLDAARCSVEVISVVGPHRELFVPVEDETSRRLGPEFASELKRSLREEGERAATEAAESFARAGFTATTKVVEGHPAEELSRAAADTTLTVVGSRDLGAVRRTLLGSVSDHLARVAPATLIAR